MANGQLQFSTLNDKQNLSEVWVSSNSQILFSQNQKKIWIKSKYPYLSINYLIRIHKWMSILKIMFLVYCFWCWTQLEIIIDVHSDKYFCGRDGRC